jgi:hypothetical protein
VWPERDHGSWTSDITDDERDRVVALLRLHCTEGRISLDEFSDRVGLVYAAASSAELDRVVHDLPVPWRDDPSSRPTAAVDVTTHGRKRRRKPMRAIVAVFSESAKRGRFRLDDESAAIAVFGECLVDLSDALIEAPEVVVTAVAVFGEVTVIVPEGIHVEIEGMAVFGERRFDVRGEAPVPGSPVVVVKAYALFGEVLVRSRRDTRRRS